MNKFFKRSGFTLVELLVVISIIGVLIGMLLPAVQQVREAARRTTCKNNLRQLALALHNYESSFEHFPPGYAYIPGSQYASTFYPIGAPDANHLGQAWGAFALPYFEQGNLHDQVNFKLPGFDVENLVARETSIPVFICPTDYWSTDSFVVRDETTDPVEKYAAASYCASWGPASATLNLDATPDIGKGPFSRNSKTRFANIADGTSSTIGLGERTNGPILDVDGTPIGVPPHPNFENVWFAAIRDIDAPDDDHGHMVLFDSQFGPNLARGAGADRGVSAPHSGLAQFAFMDGSVHTIPETIDIVTYRSLSSMNGGEIVGDYK